MQSNGNAVQTSESKPSDTSILSPSKEKKTLPKIQKRVSFDLKYRTIIHTPTDVESTETEKVVITSTNTAVKETSNINSVVIPENDKLVYKNKLETSAEYPILNNVCKNSSETEGEVDTNKDKPASPAKVNTDICDTGQLKSDNANCKQPANAVKSVNTNELTKVNSSPSKLNSTSERLRQEFVKSNEGIVKSAITAWSNRNSNNNSNNPSPKSSPNLTSRLTESQSKIAKLQQSLPTKLSDATVESLKTKYSPASFGYPKSFLKSPTEPTRPGNISRIARLAASKVENKSVFKETEIKDKGILNVNKKTTNINSKENSIAEKTTFRTEIFITPSTVTATKNEDNNNNSNIDTVDDIGDKINNNSNPVISENNNEPVASENNNKEVFNSTVKTVFISSEIFPKEEVPLKTEVKDTVVEEPNKEEPNKEDQSVISEDTSEQSSDTVTESEDSQNIKYRNLFPENENVTDTEDPETSSYTSETTCCEVIKDLNALEAEMEDGKKKPQKKRSNSFKKIFGFGSSKDKKKNEDSKLASKSNVNGTRKNDATISDNAHNEANIFDRNVPQRHTISGHYTSREYDRRTNSLKENMPSEPYYSNANEGYPSYQQEHFSYSNARMHNSLPSSHQQSSIQNVQANKAEDHLRNIKFDLYMAQQTNQQLNSNLAVQQKSIDEYVCMDSNDKTKGHLSQPGFINAHNIDKYIDTTSSSSISTLDSENKNIIYENAVKSGKLQKVQNVNSKIPIPNSVSSEKNINQNQSSPNVGEKCYERPKFSDSPEMFTTTPRRTQGPLLIKPKAIIPISTERPLPNPYRSIRSPQQIKSPDGLVRENVYGNLPSPDVSKQINDNLNDVQKPYPVKDTGYGKPIPATRRNVPGADTMYGNISKTNVLVEDDYGTVYDSLTPVGAQLVVSKPQIISGSTNMEKRSRSVSPSQRHKATNLSSSQSFNYKSKPVTPTSPVPKELEATKLHLSAKREVAKTRLKSPVDERRNQTQNRKSLDTPKKDNKKNTSTHQNLEIEIDYPDNNLNEYQDRKETPEKFMFTSNETVPNSPKKTCNLKRTTHVSPTRPKSFVHSTPKEKDANYNNSNVLYSDAPKTPIRSPLTMRSDSPSSVNSALSLASSKSKQPVNLDDIKHLKNTEVYFYEQTTHQRIPKEDISPDQSPQQVLTQATVHQQPQVSPIKLDAPSSDLRRTPVNVQPVQSKVPLSPQKQQNLQNVEAYYWEQLKKLKEKEEQEIYNQMMIRQNRVNSPAEYGNQHRSRSVEPHIPRPRRSASLPRDVQPFINQRPNTDLYGYARTGRQYPIQENVIVNTKTHQLQQIANYNNARQTVAIPIQGNFVRGSPQRNTVGPINIQKRPQPNVPVRDTIYENYFPGVQLRNQDKSIQQNSSGYAPIFKRGSLTATPISVQESPPQSNKKVSFSSARDESQNWPTKNGFTQSPPTRRVEKRMENADDDVFLPQNENVQNMSQTQQIIVNCNISTEQPTFVSNKLPPAHPRDPTYVPREAIYGKTAKQVTVTNKVCDIYGQIHEMNAQPQKIYGHIQKSGVIYGQLQPNPIPPGNAINMHNQYLNRSDPSFVRNTRLTASFNEMRSGEPPRRPLPPIPAPGSPLHKMYGRVNPPVSESESGSEAGEVQRILAQKELRRQREEEWNSDSKSGRSQSGGESGRGGVDTDGEVRSGRSSRSGRRDDPRRHTLSGSDPHYPAGMAVQGGPLSRTMDLEMPMPRGYPPPSSAMLFDDDPGIMSEVETSSTGFRRGGKQRSSLPVVRTPSKTLERPLGLVFLQYRNETKRALLPNEITSIDTVKALFVRSFPKQLTMEYLDSPLVKIYIHDSSKDMFYELEDLRSHLRDIRDRSVLRLFESADVSGGLPGPGTGISGGVGHFEDQSYFSEPEFDSEYQHQHIHKSKTSGAKGAPPYYMGSTTIPRGGPLLRAYSPAIGGPIPSDRIKSMPADRIHTDGYMSSPERGSRGQYEDPYYSQYGTRSGSITPVIDEEARLRVENMERQLANLTGLVQKALHQTPPPPREFLQVPGGRDSYRPDKSVSFEKSVSFSDEPPDMNSPKQHSPQHTERDRLKPAPPPKPASLSPAQYDNSRHIYRDLQLTPEMYNQLRGLQKKAKDLRTEVRNLRRLSQAQAHSVKETIRDTFIKIHAMLLVSGDQVWQAGLDKEKLRLTREEDLYKQEMIRLEKDLTELESTVEELRGNVINRKTRVNMSDVENMALILSKSSKTVADLKLRFPSLQNAMKSLLTSEMERVDREEKFLKEEPERLESALRRCKKLTGTLVTLKRLASVQEQRLPCSNSTGDGRLSPSLTETPPITPPSAQHSKPPAVPTPRNVLGQSLIGGDSTGSSCDGSQRPENALDALLDELQTFSKPHPVTSASAPTTVTTQLPQAASFKIPGSGTPSMGEIGRKGSMDSATLLPVQNLTVSTATGSLRRLHSYPSGSDTDNSPPIQPLARGQNPSANKPPIPERNAELLQHVASGRRVPPPPPPRTSSKSPLASPTSPSLPPRSSAPNQNALQHIQNVQNMTDKPQSQFEAATQNLGLGTLRRNVPGRNSLKEKAQTLPRNIGSNLQMQVNNNNNNEGQENKINPMSTSNSSSCESVNSQEGAKKSSRKEELEQRHQELLKKQKALQEQYARLQQLQRGNNTLTVVPPAPDLLLKKTGSESNLLQKMGLQMSAPQQMTGSLTHLANTTLSTVQQPASGNTAANNVGTNESVPAQNQNSSGQTTTAKVYETDIL